MQLNPDFKLGMALLAALRSRADSAAMALAPLAAAVVLAACSGGPSSPFSSGNSTEMLFVAAAQTWDIDKDNSVSCKEWEKYTGELFTIGDQNADGMVDAEEYKKIIKSDRLFQSVGMAFFDGNADGKLTAQEFTGRRNPAFDVLDRNKDCQIASGEMIRTRQVEALKQDGTIPGGAAPGGR